MTNVISLILWKDPQATSCQWFKQWKEKPAHCTLYNQQLFQKIQCLSITETTSVLPLVSHLWHWLLPSLGGDLYTALVLHISKLQGHKWLCIFFKGKKKKVRSFRSILSSSTHNSFQICTLEGNHSSTRQQLSLYGNTRQLLIKSLKGTVTFHQSNKKVRKKPVRNKSALQRCDFFQIYFYVNSNRAEFCKF